MISTILITVPVIAIGSTILFVGCYAALYGFASNRLTRNGETISAESQSRMQTINEGFGGIKDVLIYGLQRNFINKYTRSTKNYYASWSSNQVLSLLPRYAIEFTAYATMISAVLFLLFSFENNLSKLLPVIAVFGLASMKLLPAFQQCYFSISTMRSNFNSFLVIRDELIQIRRQKNMVKDKKILDVDITFLKSVALNDISFYYDQNKDYVLKDISIEFKANQTTGIVGASGSGKSTIINILTGLLQPSLGTIEVDGHELNESNLLSWQKNIGFVSQDIFLLDASIRENIIFGDRAKDIDPKRMDQVLQMSQLDSFVSSLPDGLDTGVGERGMQISGGQLQRIGIARALYCNPQIIVFDEATSNLDRISEKLIIETIASLRTSTTIIMIAHRLSTVKECDNIFLLNNGRLENSGNYEYLMNNSSQFFNLT
jgi:HlyD family secretion protein